MKKWLKILSVVLLGALMATGAFFVAKPARMPVFQSTSVFRHYHTLCVPYRRPPALDAAEATPILEHAIQRIRQRLFKARNRLPALSEIDKATIKGCDFTYRKGDVSRDETGKRVFDPPDSCYLSLHAEYPFWESMMLSVVPKEYSVYGDCFAVYASVTTETGQSEIYKIIQQEMDRAVEELQTAVRSKMLKAGEGIFLAVRTSDAAKVEQFLARKPELANAKDTHGLAPLHWAQDTRVAELLLAKKADVTAKDNFGLTPLHWAVYNGRFELVKLLVANRADINAKTTDGWTPTDLAEELYGEAGKATSFLLQHGGIPGLPDARLMVVLRWLDKTHLKRALQMKPNFVALKDEQGRTALHHAVLSRNREAVELLLNAGADPNIKDNYGNTAILTPNVMVDPKLLELLLTHKADLNVMDEKGRTPLDRALLDHASEIVALLRKYGAQRGVEPLRNTIMQQDMGELKVLLSSQTVDVNKKDRYGSYPVHLAVFYKNIEMLKLLLDHNADPNVRDKEGYTLFQVFLGSKEMMALLIAHGADVNARDGWGATALHHAVGLINNKEAVEFLIANKADVNAEDKNGCTPLDRAFRHSSNPHHRIVIDLLREHGGIFKKYQKEASIMESHLKRRQYIMAGMPLFPYGLTNIIIRPLPIVRKKTSLTPIQDMELRNMPDVKAASEALSETGKKSANVRRATMSKLGYHIESRTNGTSNVGTSVFRGWFTADGERVTTKQLTEFDDLPDVKASREATAQAGMLYWAVRRAATTTLVNQTGYGTNRASSAIQAPPAGSGTNGAVQVKGNVMR